jgi:hypothetical protein
MKRSQKIIFATLLSGVSSIASAEVCKTVNTAVKAAAAGVATQAALAAAPVTAVAHSSGALILTGTSGYLANTLGVVAGAWAVATAPVTMAVVGTAAVTGLGVVAVCRYKQR